MKDLHFQVFLGRRVLGHREPGHRGSLGVPLQTVCSVSAVADIPGLIRGAHQNRGLGASFLRHIERCCVLLFVVDLSAPEPWTQVDDLKFELEQYSAGLAERPHAVVANKVDLPRARANLPRLQAHLGGKAIALSAATGENLEALLWRLKELHDQHAAAEPQMLHW